MYRPRNLRLRRPAPTAVLERIVRIVTICQVEHIIIIVIFGMQIECLVAFVEIAGRALPVFILLVRDDAPDGRKNLFHRWFLLVFRIAHRWCLNLVVSTKPLDGLDVIREHRVK
ncbi:MAG: hypothetical protein R3C97_17350 [Geminicoccaceae bacterium]